MHISISKLGKKKTVESCHQGVKGGGKKRKLSLIYVLVLLVISRVVVGTFFCAFSVSFPFRFAFSN